MVAPAHSWRSSHVRYLKGSVCECFFAIRLESRCFIALEGFRWGAVLNFARLFPLVCWNRAKADLSDHGRLCLRGHVLSLFPHPGCSKRPSGKAAASEEARRTLRYVESSERSENAAGGLFQHPARTVRQVRGAAPHSSLARRPARPHLLQDHSQEGVLLKRTYWKSRPPPVTHLRSAGGIARTRRVL